MGEIDKKEAAIHVAVAEAEAAAAAAAEEARFGPVAGRLLLLSTAATVLRPVKDEEVRIYVCCDLQTARPSRVCAGISCATRSPLQDFQRCFPGQWQFEILNW